MSNVNPTAVLFIVFAAVLGALFGSALAGLAIGLGIVLFAELVA